MKTKKFKPSWNTRCKLCLLPSLIGTVVFFALPYLRMLYYSVIESQFQRQFVGLKNYSKVLQNEYFRLALRNSFLLIIICVPLLIIFSLGISLILSYGVRRIQKLRTAFILPMVIPTASIVLIWQAVFINTSTPMPVYLLFFWKNTGICVILLSAALTSISPSVFEAAKLDGANLFQMHLRITVPSIMPTVVFTGLLAIVNTFKVFKESYLFYGTNYPPDHSYTLQYYMNNHFLKLNYQNLSASAVITSLFVLMIVMAGLWLQRRYEQ